MFWSSDPVDVSMRCAGPLRSRPVRHPLLRSGQCRHRQRRRVYPDLRQPTCKEIVEFARSHAVDLVVIGPEAPLVAGLADQCEAAGLAVFGPSAKAAMIEGSKGFMKDLCARYGIPTAAYGRFDEPDAAKDFILRHGAPIVVKADGLAAGKGVIICRNENEAFAAVDHILIEAAFGEAGSEVIIEEYMEGEEASFFALVDGHDIVPLASAQDHKAAYDGDEGPNTGGMGAYSPAPVLDERLTTVVMDTIVRPTVDALKAEGRPYKGVLYAGVMVTSDGPKVLEFNARFGDPECQPLLLRLKSDLLEALTACAHGRLRDIRLEWHDDAALVVVLATRGYPGYFAPGSRIGGLDDAARRQRRRRHLPCRDGARERPRRRHRRPGPGRHRPRADGQGCTGARLPRRRPDRLARGLLPTRHRLARHRPVIAFGPGRTSAAGPLPPLLDPAVDLGSMVAGRLARRSAGRGRRRRP